MRADRLIAVLLMLQRRQRVTAAEVAAELEISVRTARRDLEALGIAGLPVYSERGRGGGWRLLGGGRTDLSGLSLAEARALFLVAGPQAHAAPELKAALRKLVQALPEPLRASAEGAASSVVVDPTAWGEANRAHRPAHLEELEAAAIEGAQVRLSYSDRSGKQTTRTVHPLGLALKGTVWYLMAGTEEGLRTFRVNRVRSVERTGEPVARPEDFDLAGAWEQVVERVDGLRFPVEVAAVVEVGTLDALRWVFGRRAVMGSPQPDGRIPVTLRGRALRVTAWELAGFGSSVEVLSPPELREELARLGSELVGAYGQP
ncbi:MAG: helix-turn-helix transcriptional regulator [Acidimicrobiales bacterium]